MSLMNFLFRRAKETDFKAGGLCLDRIELQSVSGPERSGFVAPEYIDSRPYCMAADDQSTTPRCAAFSMAGLIEVRTWINTHIPKTVDPAPLYAEAKRIDGNNSPGTYFESVFQAAKNLKLIPDTATLVKLTNFLDVKFALHKNAVCLLGFNIDDGWNKTDTRSGWVDNGTRTLGGHAVLGCYFYDSRSLSEPPSVGFQNSWSSSWGMRGFGRMTLSQFDKQFMYGVAVEGI